MSNHDFTGRISWGSGFEREISEDPFCALDYSDTGDPVDVALAARVLASHWHGGQASALYTFSSSGHLDIDACICELSTLAPQIADDLTPIRLWEEITGDDHIDAQDRAGLAYEILIGSAIDAICDAWETGVSNTFETECERILRAAIGT